MISTYTIGGQCVKTARVAGIGWLVWPADDYARYISAPMRTDGQFLWQNGGVGWLVGDSPEDALSKAAAFADPGSLGVAYSDVLAMEVEGW